MLRLAFLLLIGALLASPCEARGLLKTSGSSGVRTFVFSYPPPAHLTPINPGEDSVSFTNAFGTFSWTNHQVEDPGGTPHEQYGEWFITLTPAGGGTPQQVTLSSDLGAMAMAQDNLGIVYIEQGDANWGPFLAWSYQGGSSSPEPAPATPGPLDVPTVSGPFTPSSDGTTITAPIGTATSIAGRWTWGANDIGLDYFLLLNGARINMGSFQESATTLTINAQGNAFWTQSRTGANKVWLGYSSSGSGGSTAGPIPVGISWSPSFYSALASCQFAVSTTCAPGFKISSGSNVTGHLIATLGPTISNGGSFAGTYTLLQSGAVPTYLQIVGNQVQLSRPLNSGDLATTIGGPLGSIAWPTQNGVLMAAGWAAFNLTVVP